MRIFNFLGGFSRKKVSVDQIYVKHKQTFWKMAADNLKIASRLPSGVNEDFIRNLIWLHHHQQQQHDKIINQQQQQISSNLHVAKSVLKSFFNKISGIQPAALSKKRLRHWCFPLKLLRTCFFIEHLWTTASGRAQGFTKRSQ